MKASDPDSNTNAIAKPLEEPTRHSNVVKIFVGILSGPVLDDSSRFTRILQTTRLRIQGNPFIEAPGRKIGECSVSTASGSVDFCVKVLDSNPALLSGSLCQRPPLSKGGMSSLPLLCARKSLDNFHQSFGDDSWSFPRVSWMKLAMAERKTSVEVSQAATKIVCTNDGMLDAQSLPTLFAHPRMLVRPPGNSF